MARDSASELRAMQENKAREAREDLECHPNLKIAAQAVDAKGYKSRGETPPWEKKEGEESDA